MKIRIKHQLCTIGDIKYYVITAISPSVDIVGSCILRLDDHQTWMSSLFVNWGVREKGIGSFLVKKCIELSKLNNYHQVSCAVDQDNGVEFFYTDKHGFERLGIFPGTNNYILTRYLGDIYNGPSTGSVTINSTVMHT